MLRVVAILLVLALVAGLFGFSGYAIPVQARVLGGILVTVLVAALIPWRRKPAHGPGVDQ